ncbi:arylalkylamine N-acetyltransferase-like 7 isoform X3 [Leptinotarsa decemlineata]
MLIMYTFVGILANTTTVMNLEMGLKANTFEFTNKTCNDFMLYDLYVPFTTDTKWKCIAAATFFNAGFEVIAFIHATHDALLISILCFLKTQFKIIGDVLRTIRQRSLRNINLPEDYSIHHDEDNPLLEEELYRQLKLYTEHLKMLLRKMEYGLISGPKFDEVIKHLRNSFPDEPLNASVGLSVRGKPCELLEKYDLHTLEEGMSLMAMDAKTKEIAGVALNGISRKGDVEKSLEEMKSIDNIQYQRVFGLLNNVNKDLDLFTKYNVEKIFELRILSVDDKYRGRGLAKELFSRSEMIAKEYGFELMKVDATSFYTQKISESFGFTTEVCIKYGDYCDEEGQKIYDTKSPHDFYKVMVKHLASRPNSE